MKTRAIRGPAERQKNGAFKKIEEFREAGATLLNGAASLGTYQISRAGASYMRTPHLPGPWHYSFSSQFSAGHAKPSGRTAASEECASKNRQTGVWAC